MAYILTFGQELNDAQINKVKAAAAADLDVNESVIKHGHSQSFAAPDLDKDGNKKGTSYLKTVIPSFQSGNIVVLYNLTCLFPNLFGFRDQQHQWLYHSFPEEKLNFDKISNFKSLQDFHQHMVKLHEWRSNQETWKKIWAKTKGNFGMLNPTRLAQDGITEALPPKLTWANGNYNILGFSNENLLETNSGLTFNGQLKINWSNDYPTQIFFVKEVQSKNGRPYWFVTKYFYCKTAEVMTGLGGGSKEGDDILNLGDASIPTKPSTETLTDAEVVAKLRELRSAGKITDDQYDAASTPEAKRQLLASV